MKLSKNFTIGRLLMAVSFFAGAITVGTTIANSAVNDSDRAVKYAIHNAEECSFDLENGSFTHSDSVAKTCSSSGRDEYYSCNDCGKIYTKEGIETTYEELEIPFGHTYVYCEEVEATHTTTGVIAHYECQDCHALFDLFNNQTDLRNLTIPQQHNFVYIIGKEATCSTPGYRKIQYCEDCDLYYDSEHDLSGNAGWYDYWKRSYGVAYGEHIPGDEIVKITSWSHNYKCTVCGQELSFSHESSTPSTYSCSDVRFCGVCGFDMRHEYAELIEVYTKYPTCTEDGHSSYYTCGRCGDPVTQPEILEKTSHNFINHIYYLEPSCMYEGRLEADYCSDCNKYFDNEQNEIDIVIPKSNHTLVHIEAKNPTCDTTGNPEMLQCSVCNLYFDLSLNELEETSIPALGHNLTIIPGLEATCSTYGYRDIGYCDVCNLYVDLVYGTKGNEGWYDYWKRSDGSTWKDHTLNSEVAEITKDCHYYLCTECNCLISYGHSSSTPSTFSCSDVRFCDYCGFDMRHQYAQEEVIPYKDPTCTEEGHHPYYICLRCGDIIDQYVTISKIDHSYSFLYSYNEPTCTEVGHLEAYKCEYCFKYFNSEHIECEYEDLIIPMISHDTIHIQAIEPTCDTTGNPEMLQCSVCNLYFDLSLNELEETSIPALGHELTIIPGVEATCTANGYRDIGFCSRCGLYVDPQSGDKGTEGWYDYWKRQIGYTYASHISNNEIVRILEWGHVSNCINCGNEMGESHIYEEDQDFDCSTSEYCTVCNFDGRHYGATLTHVPEKQPTCTEDGYDYYYICDRCGEIAIDVVYHAASGHSLYSYDTSKNNETVGIHASGDVLDSWCTAVHYSDDKLVELKIDANHNIVTLPYDISYTSQSEQRFNLKSGDIISITPINNFAGPKSVSYFRIENFWINNLSNEITLYCPENGETYISFGGAISFPTLNDYTFIVQDDCSFAEFYVNYSITYNMMSYQVVGCGEEAKITLYDYCGKCYQTIIRETYYVTLPEHQLAFIDGNATCTQAGNMDYYYCEVCGKLFDETFNEVLASDLYKPDGLGHDWSGIEYAYSAPTCTSGGIYSCIKCSRCDAYYDFDTGNIIGGYYIPALSHNYEYHERKIPCPSVGEGWEEYYICTLCNTYFDRYKNMTTYESLKKESDTHYTEFYDYWGGWEPSCTNEGKWDCYICQACGQYISINNSEIVDSLDDPKLIRPTNPHYGQVYDEVLPTCTSSGHKKYGYCYYCYRNYLIVNDEWIEPNEDIDLQPLSHTLETIKGTLGTCYTYSIKDCYHCTVCDQYFGNKEGDWSINYEDWINGQGQGDLYHENAIYSARSLTDHSMHCPDCGASYGQSHIYEEDFEIWNYDNYQCSIAHKCIICGFENKHGFDYYTDYEDRPCTEGGYTEFYYCSHCDELILAGNEGNREHDWEEIWTYQDRFFNKTFNDIIIDGTKVIVRDEFVIFTFESCDPERSLLNYETNKIELKEGDFISIEVLFGEYAYFDSDEMKFDGFGDIDVEVIFPEEDKEEDIESYGDDEDRDELWSVDNPKICGVLLADLSFNRITFYYELEKLACTTVEPTCTEDGYIIYYEECHRCSTFHETEPEIIPALGHSISELIPQIDPTCNTLGIKAHFVCESCGKFYDEEMNEIDETSLYIEKLNHTVVTDEEVAATCTSTGLTEGSHCSVCGEVLTAQQTIEALGHTFVVDTEVKATCTTTGLTAGAHCSVCNEIIVEQEIIEALGHTVVTDEAIAPTCTTKGLTEGSHCSTCGETLVAQVEVEKLNHTVVTDSAVAATCTSTGLTAGEHCSVCGEILTAQQTVLALGHTTIVDAKVDPTCTTTGLTAGAHCSVCNTIIVEQEVIEALGHTTVTDTSVEPTCTTKGLTEGSHCSTCGETLVAQTEVEKLNHTVVTDNAVAATCTSTGLTDGSHCSVCGEILTAQQTVLALGHKLRVLNAIEATCQNVGQNKHYECLTCGEKYLDEETTTIATGSDIFLGLGEHKDTDINGYCDICNLLLCSHPANSLEHIAEVSATEEEYGVRAYFHCSICGSDFEDESTENVIGNIEAWKKNLGKIDKIVEEPESPKRALYSAAVVIPSAIVASLAIGFTALYITLMVLKKKKKI